jgi:hypothetical protein
MIVHLTGWLLRGSESRSELELLSGGFRILVFR